MFPILLANFSTIAAVTNSSLPPRAYLTLSFISSTEGIFFPMFQESRYCAYPLCHSRCIIYILNPTSNHNVVACEKAADRLYIFWFLHQTTTWACLSRALLRCISFDSYIKPQLLAADNHRRKCCISFDSYIKPQPRGALCFGILVVYLLIPTSNHNLMSELRMINWLYIFWFLHQTTTAFYIFHSDN